MWTATNARSRWIGIIGQGVEVIFYTKQKENRNIAPTPTRINRSIDRQLAIQPLDLKPAILIVGTD